MDWVWILAVAIPAVLIAASSVGRRDSGRHLFVALLLVACAGCVAWLLGGGRVPAPRIHVIAFWPGSERATGPILGAMQPGEKVTFVRFAKVEPPRDEQSSKRRWTNVADARGQVQRDGMPSAEFVREYVLGAGPDWSARLFLHCRELLRKGPSVLPPRGTITFVLDAGEECRALGRRPFATDGAFEVLTDPEAPIDLFVCEPDAAQRRGRLVLVPPQEPLAPCPMNTSSGRLGFELLDCPEASPAAQFKVELELDPRPGTPGGPPASASFRHTYHPTPNSWEGNKPVFRPLVLAELKPETAGNDEEELTAGWHLIRATLTVSVRGSETTYVDRTYLHVAASDMERLTPPGAGQPPVELPDVLGRSTWAVLDPRTAPPSPSALELVTSYRRKPKDGGEGRAFRVYRGDVPRPNGADPPTMLLLVEPTLERLRALETERELDRRIREGLDVLIVGPPPLPDPPSDVPAWLLVGTRPTADKKRFQLVRRTPSVHFCPDASHPMHFPTEEERTKTDALTPLTVQCQIVNALAKKLETRASQDPADAVPADQLLAIGTPGDPEVKPKAVGTDTALKTLYGLTAAGEEVLVVPPFVTRAQSGSYRSDELDSAYGLDQNGAASDTGEAGVLLQLRPGAIEPRLDLVARPASAGLGLQYLGLDPEDRHPNAHIVLFYAQKFPQADSAWKASILNPQPKQVEFATGLSVFQKLRDSGVQFHGVGFAFHEDLGSYYRDVAGRVGRTKTTDDLLGTLAAESKTIDFTSDPSADSRAAIESLGKTMSEIAGVGVIRVSTRRRGLAPQVCVAEPARAPAVHAILVPAPGKDVICAEVGVAAGDGTPVAASWTYGYGSVVALAYSPFAPDVWRADRGGPSDVDPMDRRGRTPLGGPTSGPATELQGWGIQRLIDLASFRGARDCGDGSIVPYALTELDDGSTLRMDCWWLEKASGRFQPPDLKSAAGDSIIADTISQDPLRSRMTFQLRASSTKALCDWYTMKDSGERRGERVFVNLQPALGAGRNLRERMGHVAAMSGGAYLPGTPASQAFDFARPLAWVITLVLCGLLVLLFSPLARPWTAMRLWLDLRREAAIEHPQAPHVQMDSESLLAEFGGHPGVPAARRMAGTPAGIKGLEIGDSLAVAVPATLVAFTASGRSMGLPQRLPRVRLRLAANPMLATILVDDARGLAVPERTRYPAKHEIARLLVNLVAATVWVQSGIVQVRLLRRSGAEFGPHAGLAHAEELSEFLRDGLAPAHLSSGIAPLADDESDESDQVFFLVTDGLGVVSADLRRWTEHVTQAGGSVRVVHVDHPFDVRFVGLCRDAGTGALLDRSEWTEADLAETGARRVAELRRITEAVDGRFASVRTDLPLSSMIDHLVETGFLG